MSNLFDYATKELSQDAFICWLVSNYNNELLKEKAYYFINKLSNKNYNYENDDIKHLHIFQQLNNMDIIIDIWETKREDKDYADTTTSDFVIIIEDKTDSSAHKYQLLEYGCKIDQWTKWKHKDQKKESVKIFYKANYLSWEDVRELNRYISYKYNPNENYKDDNNIKWYIEYKDVWERTDIEKINSYKDCWKVLDIETIVDIFKKEDINISEIYGSYVEYINAKCEDLKYNDKPNDQNLNKWLSYFRRIVSNKFNIKSKWCGSNFYGYAYFCVRIHPHDLDGEPYLEVRNKDCFNNKFQTRILTYGMDDNFDSEKCYNMRETLKNYLSENKTIFHVNKNDKKQLGVSNVICDIDTNEKFIEILKEYVKAFEEIMKNIKY